MTASAAPPSTPKASVLEDITEIYYAPSRVFDRHRAGQFGIALLIVAIALALLTQATMGLFEPIMRGQLDASLAAAQARNPTMTPEQVDAARNISLFFAKLAAPVVLVVTYVAAFLFGTIIWLVGKIFGSVQTYAAGVAVATFSAFPKVIELFVSGLQAGYLLKPEQIKSVHSVSLSVARLLDPATTSKVMMAVASQVSVFPLWSTALVAIGLRVTGRISTVKATSAALILWGVGVALSAVFAR